MKPKKLTTLKFKNKIKYIFIHDKLQFKLSFMSSLNIKRTPHRQIDALKKKSKISTEANIYHTFNLNSNGGKD